MARCGGLKSLFGLPLPGRVPQLSVKIQQEPDRLDAARRVVERHIARDELVIPTLPRVAVRVVRSGTNNSGNAHLLADIIQSDPALAQYVLRIAGFAARRPPVPITSLQHAIARLGLEVVANIAFTLALQGKMLHVEGQHGKARRLWRHSLASALWARELAARQARETGLCYLCGLLHDIGRAVALGAVHDAAQRAGLELAGNEYDRLIEIFHRDVGKRVIFAWALPPPVPAVAARWESCESAGAAGWESTVVNLAHKLADFTLQEPGTPARELLVLDPGYRDLGFSGPDTEALFDTAADIDAELDRYLSP